MGEQPAECSKLERHQANLYLLCRVCKDKIVTKRGYANAKLCSDYEETLQEFYGILPNEDEKVSCVSICYIIIFDTFSFQ